jgi:dipeptidyl aminopeptidase/acylaminoacyl peptidase
MEKHSAPLRRACALLAVFITVVVTAPALPLAATPVTPQDILGVKTIAAAEISPNGEWIAYIVRVPRAAGDKAGGDYQEMYVVSVKTGETRPFVTGKVSIRSPRWSPDGSSIAFLRKKDDKDKTQVWTIPADGGEASQATRAESDVIAFRWHPQDRSIAYIASTPETKKDKELKEKGYGFTYYQENLRHRNLYLASLSAGRDPETRTLTKDITVWDFEFSPDGASIVFGGSEKNLVDYQYMFQDLYVLDVSAGSYRRVVDLPGKLGNFVFSPDGSKIAYTAAVADWDHAVSQAFVANAGGSGVINLTPPDFRGHVEWIAWKDPSNVVYLAGEGTANTLSVVSARGGERKVILHSDKTGLVFDAPSSTGDFKRHAFVCNSPQVPSDVYLWEYGKQLKRLTTINPWVSERTLAKQEVIRYAARDGREIDGILYYPLDYRDGEKYPLVVTVHGGPESHYSNGWHSRYLQPPQILAARGYFVFLPNYRSSTGYGVEIIRTDHLGDPGGKEFDDIADGIDYLIGKGLVDRGRVGLGGGSYGGYAAAWFSSYYTEKVKAVCMLVGISDLISKRGSTDIPYEELLVHSKKDLEDMWELALQRSPVYHAHKSKTAVLILGGKDDPRVNPSQSLEYYTRLKMNGHPAVRLVQYPGEGHGNQKQPGRADVLYRTLEWLDWYVKDGKPIDGGMPPLDLGDRYGLELPKD